MNCYKSCDLTNLNYILFEYNRLKNIDYQNFDVFSSYFFINIGTQGLIIRIAFFWTSYKKKKKKRATA